MKLKRLVATMLTLLLMVSLLPIGAMADDLPNYTTDQGNINGQIGTNSAIAVDINKNGSVQTNTGSVHENEGTVVNNNGTVVINMAGGTVEINRQGGTVVNNNAGGTVEFNEAGGTIETNNGTVGDQRWDEIVVSTSGNYGTIETNSAGGKVLINQEGGTIGTNYGLVGVRDAEGYLVKDENTGNFGEVTTNHCDISYNNGRVVTNAKYQDNTRGHIYTNTSSGEVDNNEGIVDYNNGKVIINNSKVTNNNVNGTVKTNNSYVKYNYGTVETNNIDGTVHNYNRGESVPMSLDNGDAAPSEDKPVVAGVGTNFGTVDNDVDKKTYYGLSWGDSVDKLNSIESFVEAGTEGINLNDYAAKASRSGYKMTGYTAYYRQEGKDVEIDNTANYLMNAPTWLKILWEKLGKSTQPTRTPVYTKLSAEQVKVGTFVRCGEMTFKIIEVTDDSIRVATVGKLSDTALADMLGFLKQHLSDAQIAKLIGAPELLEQELVSKFFGGSNEHIAFYASPDLFA